MGRGEHKAERTHREARRRSINTAREFREEALWAERIRQCGRQREREEEEEDKKTKTTNNKKKRWLAERQRVGYSSPTVPAKRIQQRGDTDAVSRSRKMEKTSVKRVDAGW